MAQLTQGSVARSSPAGLAWFYSEGAWILAPHLRLLSERIVDVCTGRIPRLIVTMPPRHGKSELISRFTPAWYLGTFPDRKVILAAYSDTFAASWGRAARDVLEDVGLKVFGVRVNQEAKGGAAWELLPPANKRILRPGMMTTAGVGGGITGKGANLMVIDDPVKNAEDAQSQVIRDKQWDWWLSTARTRLQPGAGVILVMTRWHEDDLAGRFLASTDEHWEILNFPAICEAPDEVDDDWSDTLGRKPGEALWPEMYPANHPLNVTCEEAGCERSECLVKTRNVQGNYWFGAMYQQRPAPMEGNLFKAENWRYYTSDISTGILTLHADSGDRVFDPRYGVIFQTVDCAGSSKEASDYTVVSTWVINQEKELIWLDMQAAQFESLDVGGFVRRNFNMHRPSLLGVERVGFGLTVIQELIRDGLPVIRLEPNTDKVSRALPAVARTEEHRVYLPKNAEWKDRALAQLHGFPNAANDDIVDTVSYAALMLPDLAPRRSFTGGSLQKSHGQTMLGGFMGSRL